MEQVKTILKFSVRVYIALVVINFIGSYVPILSSFMLDPMGTIKSKTS